MINKFAMGAGVMLLGCAWAAAAPVTYTDTGGDQVGSPNKARDIISASLSDDANNLYITVNLDPGADLSSTNNFNYAFCFNTGPSSNGDTQANGTTHGNAYSRTFSFDSTVGGMTDFLGIFGSGATTWTTPGFNTYVWNSTTQAWSKTDQVTTGQTVGSQPSTSTHNTFTVTVPKTDFSNVTFTAGNTIYFDIFSTGTGAGQTAYDSLIDQSPTNGSNSATLQYNATTLGSYVIQATTAPEPTALGLLGLAGLAVRRRARA